MRWPGRRQHAVAWKELVSEMVQEITADYKNFVAGEWVSSPDKQQICNPSEVDDVIGNFNVASSKDAETAISAASAAFPKWSHLGIEARAEILDNIGNDILQRVEETAQILSREEGKPLGESRDEIGFAGKIFKYYAVECMRAGGETGRSLKLNVDVEVIHEAVGTFALITPWNFPFLIPAWKAAPALAYGNCAILKPSELTNGSAVMLTEIIAKYVPAGVFQMLMGPGASIGPALCESPGVSGVSFTGSHVTGAKIALAAHGRSARLQMEMGGKNPLVVLADADMELALDAAVRGAFHATGQRCTASSRIIIEDAVHDQFVTALVKRMEKLRIGHALDAATELGPVVSEQQLNRIRKYIELGKSDGLSFVGGHPQLAPQYRGYYQMPGLFVDTPNDHAINREEIFGPVTATLRARNFEHALHLANDTRFGLSAGIFTASLKHATAFKKTSNAGMVMINLPTFGSDFHVPFGGRGASSYGVKEMGTGVRDFFTQSKTAYVLS